jgi:thymidine kinase
MAVVGPTRSFLSGASSGVLANDGQIQLILGPMFAGKTSELLRRTRRFGQYKRCLLIAYKGDNRYTSEASVVTHDQTGMKAKSVERLSEIENAAHSYNVIGIDEGQFFPGESKCFSVQ